jgi:uncharacterized protein YaaN involved in tellurite resistance
METRTADQPLVAANIDLLKQDLAILEPQSLTVPQKASDPINEKAKATVQALINMNINQLEDMNARNAAETMGLELQMEAGRKSAMLKQPIAKLSKSAEDGGSVANALVELKINVEALDPADVNFEAGWFSRTLGLLPFIGSPLKRYFTRYEAADTVIDAIINSLKKGAEQLKRDNITMQQDQTDMRALTKKLQTAIQIGMSIDTHLNDHLTNRLPSTDPKHAFLQNEVLFPIRQRIIDLQQQLAVNQQGVLSLEMIVRNNQELIRGVNRATNVTVNALQIAVTVALALANQKIVLTKINAVNETTNNLIADNARRLKQQGVEIQKQAVSASLEMEKLKQAFADIQSAIEDITKFRQEALPQMAATILEFDQMTQAQEQVIQEQEQGNRVKTGFAIAVE